ncbi:molybdopterin molybdotransferase MoeA [Lagierella sp.]|uniref:molybdopterin molybdotransferase MoeA n=1 Tax=Lagierella sp. TaxID=2849657 RepID=UPI00261B94B1|nr:molybdopterin molybdotransferase MoeA [Lagierella sp.]
MVDVNEAIEILKDNIDRSHNVMEIPFDLSYGYILGEDIISKINVPEFPKSAMDGYAFKHDDLEENKEFNVIGELAAGDYKRIEYKKDSSIRVMTGAYVPQDYDCVVKQEDVEVLGKKIIVKKPVEKYMNYCKIGEDVKEGQILLKSGQFINSNHIGIFASLGFEHVKVIKPLKVAIISTGSELLSPGEKLELGKIYCSSLFTIKTILEKYKIDVVHHSIISDDIKLVCDEIKKVSLTADVIITTGGVSVGKYDHIPKVYKELDAKLLFRKVAMKPGTPVSAAKFNDSLILSLSGNPFAATVNFQVLFWPIAEKFYNSKFFDQDIFTRNVIESRLKTSKLKRFVRAKADGHNVKLEKLHSSSVISNLSDCNCLVIQEPGKTIEEGDKVNIIYLF